MKSGKTDESFLKEVPRIPLEVLMILAVKETDRLVVETINKRERTIRLVNLSNGKDLECQIARRRHSARHKEKHEETVFRTCGKCGCLAKLLPCEGDKIQDVWKCKNCGHVLATWFILKHGKNLVRPRRISDLPENSVPSLADPEKRRKPQVIHAEKGLLEEGEE